MSGGKARMLDRWHTGCPTGKRTYDSKAAARAARKHLKDGTGRLSIYTCGVCDGIHLGHLPREVIRGVTQRDNVSHIPNPQGRRS